MPYSFTAPTGSLSEFISAMAEQDAVYREYGRLIQPREEPMPATNKDVRQGIDATVMIIREKCMDYFKHAPGILDHRNIFWHTPRVSGSRHYERDEYALRDLMFIQIDDDMLLSVHRNPDTVVLYLGTLGRSKTMREVQAGIRKFLHKWLPAVRLESTAEGNKGNWRGDRERVAANIQPRKQPVEQWASAATFTTNISTPYVDVPVELGF